MKSHSTFSGLVLAIVLLTPLSAHASSPNLCDFDGDGKSDPTIARDAGGQLQWWVLASATSSVQTFPWGLASDSLLCGDIDQDGLDDAVVWRSNAQGTYYVRLSAGGVLALPFGTIGDVPLIGDFDGDGTDDLAVWRAGTPGYFWVRRSSDMSIVPLPWGTTGDVPYAGDFDGDAISDLAVQRGSVHWILSSVTSFPILVNWGLGTDSISPLDRTGDGLADLTAIRDQAGFLTWYTRDTSMGGVTIRGFGVNSDTTVPADYDGDGKADVAIFRPASGQWWVLRSSDSGVSVLSWGTASDDPVQNFEVH